MIVARHKRTSVDLSAARIAGLLDLALDRTSQSAQ
jgi:hypothetical protein